MRSPAMVPRILDLVMQVHRDVALHLRGPVLTFWVFHVLRDYARRLVEGGSTYENRIKEFLKITALTEARSGPYEIVFGHNDLLAANFLDDGARLWLIDWEFSGMSDPAWDLAYAVLEHEMSADEEQVFLQAYAATGAAVPEAGRLGVMKAKCDAVSALWALEQVVAGRDEDVFLPFARQRRGRALRQLARLS